MDTPSDMNQTGYPPVGGTGDQDPTPTCVPASAGAQLSVRPALTPENHLRHCREPSKHCPPRTRASAHRRRQAQAPPPWDTTKAGAGVRAVPPSSRGGVWNGLRLVQRAMLDWTVVTQAGTGTLKKGSMGSVGEFLKNTQLRPYFCVDLPPRPSLPTSAPSPRGSLGL